MDTFITPEKNKVKCNDCSKPREEDKSYCQSCHARRVAINRKLQEQARLDPRFCSCGRLRETERFKKCDDCRGRVKRYQAKFRIACKEKGLCIQCGKNPATRSNQCQSCYEKHRDRRDNKPEVVAVYAARFNVKRQIQAYQAYGGRCACCNEQDYSFLTIDHIHGGGRKHEQEIGGGLYDWLFTNNYPEGFQVLCWNCNAAKHIYGVCPHQTGNGLAKKAERLGLNYLISNNANDSK